MNIVAALDVGTTTARAAVFGADGEQIAVARTTLTASHPFPGAVEHDPDELVASVVRLLAEAVTAAGIAPDDVAALGITNQRSTVVAWDADTGAALRPAIGWQDTRTADRVETLIAQGIPLNTSASCSKLEWLMTHDEDVMAAASRNTLRLGTVDSWLTWALSGGAVYVTYPSNAGATGLYDFGSGDWADGALDLFGVSRDSLATIVATDETVAECLAARCGDQMAAGAAHGLTEGMAKLTLGTSGMLDIASGRTPKAAPVGCYTLPMWRRTLNGELVEEFLIEGSIQTAGSVIEWLVRVGLLESVEMLDPVASPGRPGLDIHPAENHETTVHGAALLAAAGIDPRGAHRP